MQLPDLLNVGCGNRVASGWTNIDFNSSSEAVRGHDLNRGIPFPDASFDVVYHSHLLEHFPRERAAFLVKECHRVLRADGLTRIVVPDLELLARKYICSLEAARASSPLADADHEWSVIHLIDQIARHQSGGEMQRYIAQMEIPNLDYVVAAWGSEAVALRARAASKKSGIAQRIARALRNGRVLGELRMRLLRSLLGRNASNALRVGQFRLSGEVHQWMYDEHSLSKLLGAAGFDLVRRQSATTSAIPGWAGYYLDTEADGSVYRPDSLYLEARKAERA